MDRRLPRRPALRSPVLSPKSPAISENYKSGCAWGLICFFDFCQGGKLISDKKRVNRQVKADCYTRNRPNFRSNEEKAQCKYDALDNKNNATNSRKPEVEKIIEEEMSVKHQTKRNTAVNARKNLQFKRELTGHSKDHQKASKSFNKFFSFPAHGCDAATDGYRQPSDQNIVEKSSHSSLASMTEASANNVHANNRGNPSCKSIRGRKLDRQTEINLRVQVDEAVEAFVNQKLTDGENLSRNVVTNRSKNFIDALEILNSNKELFLKLLQDPNSLLAKHIQSLRDSQGKKQQPQSSSKGKTSQVLPQEAGESLGPTHAQMFDSFDGCLSEESDMPQPLSTMVVLKDGTQNCSNRTSNWPSAQSHYSLRKKDGGVRPTFLSFEHMKRKLGHAMRVDKKEQCLMSIDDIHKYLHDFEQFKDGGKELTTKENGEFSGSKSYQNVRMSKSSNEIDKRDAKGQTENFDSGIGKKAASSTESCQRTSNMSTLRPLKGEFNPRKHLSDMLNGGNEDFQRKQTPRVLDSSMSLPEYDWLPTCTPGKDKEHWFAYPHMRFSPYSNFSTANGYKWMVQKEKKSSCLTSPIKNLGAQPASHMEKPDDCPQGAKESILGDISPATKVLQTFYCLDDDLSHKVNQASVCLGKIMERNHAFRWDKRESNALEVTLEPHSLQNTNTNQRTEAVNAFGESENFECSKLNSPSGDQTSSSYIDDQSSSPLCIQRSEDSISMTDRAEQPSPISVLEQFFVEDNTSSPSSATLPVTSELNDLQKTNTNQRTEAVDAFGESKYFESSKLSSSSGDQTSSSVDFHSSSPLRTERAEAAISMIRREEQPSPVLILEQFFIEAEPQGEPSCIDIEELYASSFVESHLNMKSDVGTPIDKQGSLSKCIRAVLQIAGLNCDELSRKWHLLDQMLDPALFDNIEVWPEKSCNDRRLFVGYICEVLWEIYQYYFRCSPWVSLLNPRPRIALSSKNIVHEVLRHVDWLLLSELPQQTLQQLVEKDLAKSGNWIDIQPDTEEVVTELVDSILEDLVVDAAI